MNQRGSVAIFFAAVMLPLLMILFSLSIDATRYYRESGTAQEALDEAATHAVRFLPFQEEAAESARRILARHGEFFEGTTLEVTSDTVSLDLTRGVPLSFASFFWSGAQIPISVHSSARTTPYDIYLAVDSSNYLSPPFGSPLWDEGNLLEWPAAYFFEQVKEIRYEGQPIDARWLTQQCFNSAFSYLKLAGIRIYEYLAGFGKNSIGVGLFPGVSGELIQEARPLSLSTLRVGQGGDAVFPPYNRLFASSEYCAAAAELETHAVQYRVPESNERISRRFVPPLGAPSIVAPQSWTYQSPEYDPFLQVKEVIWSRATHEATPRSEDLIAAVLGSLMSARFDDRGGLVNSSVRLGIILAGDVPWSSDVDVAGSTYYRFGEHPIVEDRLRAAIRSIADQLQQPVNKWLNIKLLYVVFSHPELPEAIRGSHLAELKRLFSELERKNPALEGDKIPNLSLQVISTSSPESLVKEVAGTIVMLDRNSMVSR